MEKLPQVFELGAASSAVPIKCKGLCDAIYDMSMGYGLTIFSNLYNFPLNKVIEAAELINPYKNLTASCCLRTEASQRPHGKAGYGQDYRAP